MSRGYYKTCGRKVAPPPPAQSIQFGSVFCEKSNKPSAAKSTGTLGKWGVTSFTSIRSSSFTVGTRKNESGGYKRSRVEANKTSDAYSYSNEVSSDLSPAAPKPKKFFKSRNADANAQSSQNTSPIKKFGSKKASAKPAPVIVDKEIEDFGSKVEEKSPEPSGHNPPIVLRIFKGTAQLLTDESYAKEGRRRSLSVDSNEEPTKKQKQRLKDLEELRQDLENEDEGGGDEEDDDEQEQPEPTGELEEDEEEVPPEINLPIREDKEPQLPPATYVEPNILDAYLEQQEMERKNQELLEQGHSLLESTYADQDKVNQILDLSATGELKSDHLMDADDDDEDDEDDDPSDLPLDLHIPHVEEPVKVVIKREDILPSCDDINKDESNSDSDYSETLERPSVVHSVPAQPRPAKKGCIFKSRQGEKRNAHYIHKWSDKDEAKLNAPAVPELKVVEGEFSETLTRVTNYVKPDEFSEEPETYTSVTCNKNVKEFYTVVRNVKKAHQIQESGEFQEFNDDVEYILDTLQDNNPIGTRCLSAITLASKCMTPAFRMHVRAHGTVAKFFKALHDASKDQSLGMCTATVMFVLSQDRLNMDLDRESLELMLSLLESDASSQAFEECGFSAALLAKTKDRVLSLCHEIKEQGHANHLNLDNITVGQLAMETLLSLTSKRAGEWFKEELRDLGGLEHIVGTIIDTASCIEEGPSIVWSTPLLDRMRKLDRCLRVLENVTLNNEDNSKYLLNCKNGAFVDTAMRVLTTCSSQLLLYPVADSRDKASVGAVLKDTLAATLKILINITHDFSILTCGPAMVKNKDALIDTSLHVLLIIPEFVPEDQKFDLTFMSLMLLINLVEHCEENRKVLMETSAPPHPDILYEEKRPAPAALVVLFLRQEEMARNVERKTDAILDGENKPPVQTKTHEEFVEETIALVLQKAGRHMEYTFVAAYIATLLGYLTLNNKDFENAVRGYLPSHDFSTMVSVLQKFYNFMTLTAANCSASNRGIKATEMMVKHLTAMDQPVPEEELIKPKLELENLFY